MDGERLGMSAASTILLQFLSFNHAIFSVPVHTEAMKTKALADKSPLWIPFDYSLRKWLLGAFWAISGMGKPFKRSRVFLTSSSLR